jgi:DNA polymerase (family X)
MRDTLVTINTATAGRLEEVARMLEEQGANSFRVGAYRRAATTLRELDQPVTEIVRKEGLAGLQRLPGIGETIARFVHSMVTTGRLPILDRLRGESDPISLFRSVPGIGKVLAERLHDELGIQSLEELELAAHDGRLASVMHLGEKRIAGIRDSLASRLGRIRAASSATSDNEPTVAEILEVDREYRQKSDHGLLPMVAPGRFNPLHQKWLPILHTLRRKRHYTALFSNTPRAHQLGKTFDWVVIYYDGTGRERQCTVITAMYGPLADRRIVCGREEECRLHYLTPLAHVMHQEKVYDGFSI